MRESQRPVSLRSLIVRWRTTSLVEYRQFTSQ
jgi:hypothetical protein